METMQKGTSPLKPGSNSRPKNDEKIRELTKTAWNFAYAVQWSGEVFSQKEITAAKEAITAFLKLHISPELGYAVFIQRMAIAQSSLSKIPFTTALLPSHWFDWRNDDGFISTKAEYDRIENTRGSMPLYKQELGQLPYAVKQFCEDPTKETFQQWKTYFAARKANALFQFFQAAAINQLYPE